MKNPVVNLQKTPASKISSSVRMRNSASALIAVDKALWVLIVARTLTIKTDWDFKNISQSVFIYLLYHFLQEMKDMWFKWLMVQIM